MELLAWLVIVGVLWLIGLWIERGAPQRTRDRLADYRKKLGG
jgi:hypothetical protein